MILIFSVFCLFCYIYIILINIYVVIIKLENIELFNYLEHMRILVACDRKNDGIFANFVSTKKHRSFNVFN